MYKGKFAALGRRLQSQQRKQLEKAEADRAAFLLELSKECELSRREDISKNTDKMVRKRRSYMANKMRQ